MTLVEAEQLAYDLDAQARRTQERMLGFLTWDRLYPFGGAARTSTVSREQLRGALVHVLMRLSRGSVPHAPTIEGILDGTLVVPRCGYVHCNMVYEEHVH